MVVSFFFIVFIPSASPSSVDCCVGGAGSRQSKSYDFVIVVYCLDLPPLSSSSLSPSHRRCRHLLHPFRVIIISWLLCWGVRRSERDDVFIVLVDGFVAPPPHSPSFQTLLTSIALPPYCQLPTPPSLFPSTALRVLPLLVVGCRVFFHSGSHRRSHRRRRSHMRPPLSPISDLIVDCVRNLPPPSNAPIRRCLRRRWLRRRRRRRVSTASKSAVTAWRLRSKSRSAATNPLKKTNARAFYPASCAAARPLSGRLVR
jgi:hypothetical protein